MVKPDGAAKGLTDEIVARIERAGLKIVSMRRMRLDRGLAEELYSMHRGKDFFERLVEHVLSGEVVVMLVEGERAITQMRELSGATDPTKAAKGTIRSDFGSSITENVIHAADSAESAEQEMLIFFGKPKILSYEHSSKVKI
ncbi:Nucleoside diphosphate kinase [subsurface metagenome]